jgi:hypothetical protein
MVMNLFLYVWCSTSCALKHGLICKFGNMEDFVVIIYFRLCNIATLVSILS